MFPIGLFNNLFQGDGLIILIIVLILFGGKKLPELARSLGSALSEFNKAKDEVHRQIQQGGKEPQGTQTAQPPAETPANTASAPAPAQDPHILAPESKPDSQPESKA